MTQTDYYETLGVPKTADAKQIKDAYRELAFRYHPDRNRDDPQAADRMKRVNEAYAVLSNAGKRGEYDRLRERFGGASARDEFRRAYTDRDIFSGSDIFRIFEEMARMHGMRGFEDIFKETYGPRYQTFEFKRPGFYFRGFVFGPGHHGGKRAGRRLHHGGHFPGLGQGKWGRYLLEKITGQPVHRDGAHIVDTVHLSPEQAAAGGPYAYFHRKRGKKLVVKIPPGVRENQKIRLPGLGEEGRGGGRSGDLFLRVEIRRTVGEKVKGWFGRLLGR
jgi:DnaJ-class molecular chaperone